MNATNASTSKRLSSNQTQNCMKKTKTEEVLGPKLNHFYAENVEKLSEWYANDADTDLHMNESYCHLITSPFKVVRFHHFLEDSNFLLQMKQEIRAQDFIAKNNDLYRFTQTSSLHTIRNNCIQQLITFFSESILPFMKKITNIELNQTIDLTASKYEQNDYLLCHDDELEGRRIAFILYLVPEWEKSDGGALDLFDHDADGQPSRIVNSLIPQWNTFLFFEVTPYTFHQVAEVLSDSKTRLSINGWFHGDPIIRPKPFIEPPLELHPACHVPEELLRAWINPIYLLDETQLQIQSSFAESSEIQLQDFLNDENYNELARALKDCELIEWNWTQPPNKRKYENAIVSSFPPIVKEAFDLFKSEAMFLILSNLTGIKLHDLIIVENEEESNNEFNPRCRGEVRRWSASCYTLVHDDAMEVREGPALDVIIHFNTDFDYNRDDGGFVSYIAKDEDEELLTIEPSNNCLNIVFRDEGTTRFNKYVTNKCEDVFHDFSFVYYQ